MRLPFFSKIGTTEALLLMRNLSITLRAGVPLTRAFELFERDATRSRRAVIAHLRKSVETGHPLAQAMETSPRAFPPIAVSLVRVGELGGTLEESLDHIVHYLHKSTDLKRKVQGAMMYPTFVLIAVVGLGLSIATLVLPELIPLFESLDVELPTSTKIILKLAEFFEQHGTVFAIVVVLSFVQFLILIRLEIIKPLWHRFLLAIPYLGKVLKYSTVAQISETLGTLLRSGIYIREAITATVDATENRVFRSALERTIPIVDAGHTFSEGLRDSVFPEMGVTLIEIGEETGTFAETLEYLARFYEEEVDYSLKNLTTAIEPVLLIGIGVLVGFTVLAIITPIYNVTGGVI